ncbi:hypothetical protein BD414DRAFT_537030 [Trametes punicea]|nr:hypothetical protein BD414DRAFT_537030 [Trametes punicea]
MYTNIDFAIATVKGRGEELTVPNVLAAYMQCVAPHVTPEDAADSHALAKAAMLSFERAMDKYPAPAPPRLVASKGNKAKSVRKEHPDSEVEAKSVEGVECAPCSRPFCAEVAQLRIEYQRSMWRASEGNANRCTCPSCGCLVKVRSDQVRKLPSDGEDDGVGWSAAAPGRDRRSRKTKKVIKKKARAVQNDPYAPSTSRAAI